MALDPIQIRNFQEKARSAGYSESQIQDFINDRMKEQYAIEAVKQGYTTPEKAIGDVGYGIVPGLSGVDVKKQREPLSGEQARILGYASSGLRSVENIKEILDTEPTRPGLENRKALIVKGLTFGQYPRDLKAEYDSLTEAIGRLHSQGAINKQELAKFERMLPSALDDPETAEAKLNKLSDEINTVLQYMGVDPTELTGGAESPKGEAQAGLAEATGLPESVASSIQNIEDFLPETPALASSGLADTMLEDQAKTDEEERLAQMTPAQRAVEQYGGWIPPTFSIVAGLSGGVIASPTGPGALAVGAVASGAGYGAGLAVQRNLEQLVGIQDKSTEELAKEAVVAPLVVGVTDLVGGKAFQIAGKAIAPAVARSTWLKAMGEWTALRAIRPTKTQMDAFREATGIELKDFVIKNGIFKAGVDEVDNLITPLQNQFDDIIANSGRTIRPQDVYDIFQNKIDDMMQSTSPTIRKMANQLEEAMLNFIDKYGDDATISLADLTKERKLIDKLVKPSNWKTDPEVANLNTQLRRIYQESIQDAVADIRTAGGKNLKELGIELRNLYDFKDIVSIQQYLGQGTLPIGLLKTIGLGSLGATIGLGSSYSQGEGADPASIVKGALVGIGLPWLINKPGVVQFLSKNLIRAGQAVNKLPENQKLAFMNDVFRRLLTNLGAMKILHFGETGYEQEKALPAPTETGLPRM